MNVFLRRLSTEVSEVESECLNTAFRALTGLNLVLGASAESDPPEALDASDVFDPESLEASEVFDPENMVDPESFEAIDVDDPENLEAIENGMEKIDFVLQRKQLEARGKR